MPADNGADPAAGEAADNMAAESRQLWEVVGGADKGGILVRDGRALASPQLPDRLSIGAIIEEIELVQERLHYKRVSGSGPETGWISIVLKDKVLACRVKKKADEIAIATWIAEDAAEVQEEVEDVLPMSPPDVDELTEEAQDQQNAAKQDAQDAADDGDLETALRKWSEAITIGCASASLYVRRAETLVKLGRPRAAVTDCSAALAINPDFGKAFKVRARARVALKQWRDAHADFQQGLRIDYDEGTYLESQAVAEKATEMKAVATAFRLQNEEAERRRKAQQEEERRKLELARRQRELEEKQEKERLAAIHATNPFVQRARRQGWMGDFLGVKRGACTKCCTCKAYAWQPVRVRA